VESVFEAPATVTTAPKEKKQKAPKMVPAEASASRSGSRGRPRKEEKPPAKKRSLSPLGKQGKTIHSIFFKLI
jgi:hypothetical protein